MENFISKQLLNKSQTTSDERIALSIDKIFSNILNKKEKKEYGIFLSHKHTDIELVYQFKKMLVNLNIDVYVDWLDKDMPITTNQETALKLKERIKDSKKFVLLATDDAINSKWCNWELGFGDAHKYFQDIAILPVTNTDSGNWTGNEYLKTYPAITISKIVNQKQELYVEFMGNKVKFTDWLKK